MRILTLSNKITPLILIFRGTTKIEQDLELSSDQSELTNGGIVVPSKLSMTKLYFPYSDSC